MWTKGRGKKIRKICGIPPRNQAEKNVKMLTERQALFKQAALEAKKAGNMEEAKEYLRQFKGFDRLIESARGGRPVDFNTLPVPPQQIRGKSFHLASGKDTFRTAKHATTSNFLHSCLPLFSSLLCEFFRALSGKARFRFFGFWRQNSPARIDR